MEEDKLEQLTFFPERITLLNGGEQLQISNRYGVFRTDNQLKSITPAPAFPSFVGGEDIETGKLVTPGSSPDGSYLIYLNRTSPGYADLILYDVRTDEQILVTESVEHSLDQVPTSWSPDSQFFVYSKEARLYYFSIDQLREERLINESFREIGRGTIANVQWGRNLDLYYVSGSLVYRIGSAEFFTRTLYAKLLNIGAVVGKLPFDYDQNFDSFWVSPDGGKILLNKGGRNVFFIFLNADDYATTGELQSLPYLFLPRNTTVSEVLWSEIDIITLLTSRLVGGEKTTSVFRLDLNLQNGVPTFIATEDSGVRNIILSPDESRVAVLTTGEVSVRDYRTWIDQVIFVHPEPMHALWRSDNEIIVSGAYYTELVYTEDERTTPICASQPGRFGYVIEDSGDVLLETGDKLFSLAVEDGISETETFEVKPASVTSTSYRIYLQPLTTGRYQNMIMVRDIEGFGTNPLFSRPEPQFEMFPEEDEEIDFSNFTHGSRIRRREVALVFNAIDSVEGLSTILDTLSEYSLTGTFFVNGEFIRRHPGAVREIADSGHEVGSLFFAHFNMTDASFRLDKEFIKQGLARNEDDYFTVTGKELALLWHAPFYFANTDIITASREMNYVYVGRDIDPLDWVSSKDPKVSSFYLPTASLIERVLNLKKPGSIVPIRIGVSGEGRDDYLFHHLDILINGLFELGYTVVPVSTLIEHAK